MLAAMIRLTAQLNALRGGGTSPEVAEHAITAGAAVHHVVDPDDVLGHDPLHAIALETALPALARREPAGWLLTLPRPGRLGALRGPAPFNLAAIEAGAALLGLSAGLGLVPIPLGSGLQWRVHRAERPVPSMTAYDAERELERAVRRATRSLTELDVAGGERPHDAELLHLPPDLAPRRRHTIDRAYRLLLASEHALDGDGGAISLFELDARTQHLRDLRDAAADTLAAAVSADPAGAPRHRTG